MSRAAVLMGLLSYTFVTVTLIADLGLPWHFYQLGIQAPEQSAMFEVSWCVGLYVTVLLIEFLPVAFERWGLQKAMEIWKRWSGVYVVFAATLFVYLLSRNLVYAAVAAGVFSLLAFRAQELKGEPIMLAIAAVTLSTMHQSSLGSLFLLMPDKLAPQWWSPVMPISFFLSSIAAGTAWSSRVGCPFCENADDQRLRHLGLEGEAEVRIDYCGNCGGYLKTYNGGEGSGLFGRLDLLDVIARDHGLIQFAASLYQMQAGT